MTTLHLTPAGTILRLRDAYAYRLGQAIAFATPQRPPAIPPEISLRLRPGTLERLRTLTPADQNHLLAVGQALRAQGVSQDVWISGLLHDIGKSHQGKHVRLLDRGLWVMGSRVPALARAVRRCATMPRFGSGVWIAAHHAELGHDALRELGYNERICTLVAFHEDEVLARLDPELAALRAADDARHAIPRHALTHPATQDEAHGHPG
ncbi:MAG: HD domain-containing protein [Thermomicrobiales bacterium]